MNKTIYVAWMYPDVLNLHGERGNAKAFELISKQMGVKELREIFSEFSKPKRDSYSALIGLNLSNGGK